MKNWWKKACVYQVYPASFNDTSGSGTGDLRGVTHKLDYLQDLGIDVIWLSPVYASPMADNGYDISDYYAINPLFGTMEDMDALIEEAENRGIKIIMDLVVNHTSDAHKWFEEAKANPDSPYRDYYIFRDDKGQVPNDMDSIFGGPAWTLDEVSGMYYFHLFTKEQPDLNWENPAMRNDVYKMMNWWLDKGIAGFRMDVIEVIGKIPDEKITDNGPMLHPYIQEMNAATYKGRDILTVGECWGATIEDAKKYSNPDGSELSMVFQFDHVKSRWGDAEKWLAGPVDLQKLKEIFSKWQHELYGKGWNSLFFGNHDLPRSVSFWGNDTTYRVESAKMLATLLHGMQGTPYIYQGEELGMTNIQFDAIEDYKDVETLNYYRIKTAEGEAHDTLMSRIHTIGRDNARTPMQWSSEENAGFTSGQPWLAVNPNYKEINAAQQVGTADSVYSYYKALIALRKAHDIFISGNFELIMEGHPQIFAYTRRAGNQTLYCVCNFSDTPADIDLQMTGKDILIHNYKEALPDHLTGLKPYEAFMAIASV